VHVVHGWSNGSVIDSRTLRLNASRPLVSATVV
jgi:hypothetical protein